MAHSLRTRGGFTLIELLVATALGAVLLLLAAQVFQTAMRTRDRVRQVGAETTALRRAYELIGRDLHSAVVVPEESGLTFGLAASPTGAPSGAFQLASAVGEPLLVGRAVGETVIVQYSVEEDPRTGRPGLWRRETPYPVLEGGAPGLTEDTRSTLVLPDATNAAYLFYSPEQTNWIETWDGQVGLPTAVRVDLTLEEPDGRGEPRQESWVFSLPASQFANDEAAVAAAAEEGAEAAQ